MQCTNVHSMGDPQLGLLTFGQEIYTKIYLFQQFFVVFRRFKSFEKNEKGFLKFQENTTLVLLNLDVVNIHLTGKET